MPNTPSGTRMRPDADAAGLALQVADLAHRVGHRGDLLAAFGHGVDDLRRQLQPVEQRRGQAGGACGFQVQRIGLLQRAGVGAQPRGQRAQGLVARAVGDAAMAVAAARAATPT